MAACCARITTAQTAEQAKASGIYDATRKAWHQSWVTNRGKLLIIEGKFEDGGMILAGTDYSAPGQPTIRGIWKLEDGDVRETATTSSDGGATWEASIRFDFPTAQSPNQR
jgi:hypothetical protein